MQCIVGVMGVSQPASWAATQTAHMHGPVRGLGRCPKPRQPRRWWVHAQPAAAAQVVCACAHALPDAGTRG